MGYRSGSVPLEAVVSASFRTGLLGSAVIAATFASDWFSLSGNPWTPAFIGGTVFLFAVVLFLGTAATALCLSIFGLPIANLASNLVGGKVGIILALASALLISFVISAFVLGVELLLIVLAFAVPAGIFFRSEILLHREIED